MGFENTKLDAWKAAELAARQVERDVRLLLLRRSRGGEIDDVAEKIATAAVLRAAAHELLEIALKDIEVTAKALHYRNVTTPTIRPFQSPEAATARGGSWSAMRATDRILFGKAR